MIQCTLNILCLKLRKKRNTIIILWYKLRLKKKKKIFFLIEYIWIYILNKLRIKFGIE